MLLSSRPSADHRVVLAALAQLGALACPGTGLTGGGRARPGHGRADVVHPHPEWAQRRGTDPTERAGNHPDSPGHIEVPAPAVGNYSLSDVAPRAGPVTP